MAIGPVDIELLELRRRRQEDVGIVGRVRLEDLVDDREEVLPRKAGDDLRRIGRDGDRV